MEASTEVYPHHYAFFVVAEILRSIKNLLCRQVNRTEGDTFSASMPTRAGSPAASENGFDITEALLGSSGASFPDAEAQDKKSPHNGRIPQEVSAGLEESQSDDASFIADLQVSANRKSANSSGKGARKSGGFQSFGVNGNLLKAIARKGFTVPTPIQRKTIPLILDGQDVVGMARTGSGKTAAFVVPMIEKLKSHSTKVGARALILSPSRELALQTLKVVKEMGRGTDLRSTLLVGGDSLEEQFSAMAANPDIVIATPGRFLHLKVEMGLDLSSISYAVFDEADRLFEMGFAAQLAEILHALPSSRQTLLFSATLPKSLVEFAKAGLQEPHLIRLDAESKISSDLQSAFFTLKTAEKEGALIHILLDVIKMPVGETEAAAKAKSGTNGAGKKRKRDEGASRHDSLPAEHATIVFVATKHHVEYISTLLRQSGFAVSHAYGSLDQTARKIQVQDFRTGMTNILVVTDVAARGIDIPILANVINYDFPPQPKVFVHRVGRTARAGQKGWSYSLIRASEIPYLLDLQLFLAKRLVLDCKEGIDADFVNDVVVGSLVREELARSCEWIDKLLDKDSDLLALRAVALKGEKLYLKSRSAASAESARRAKEISSLETWGSLHPLFSNDSNIAELQRERMLARVSSFKPQETIFEMSKLGTGADAANVMKKRRATVEANRQKRARPVEEPTEEAASHINSSHSFKDNSSSDGGDESRDIDVDMLSASSEELEITFSQPFRKNKPKSLDGNYKDDSFFMSYMPTGQSLAEERGYGVHSGGNTNSNFLTDARSVTMDLTNDDGGKDLGGASRVRWDKKAKKYVSRANDEDGSKGTKYIQGESGQKIAASFRSGRYDAWKRAHKLNRVPRTGDAEPAAGNLQSKISQRRWKHKRDDAPKDADKFRDDFYKRKKRVEEAKDARRGRFKDGAGKSELKGVDAVRKERKSKEKRKEKNGKGKKGRGGN